jgi:hypothetical protein
MLHAASPLLHQLPPELLDALLHLLDAPSDVLALSSTCRVLYKLAVPAHLHYRHIAVRTTRELGLWAHLSSHPHLARNVRVLRIGASREEQRVPPKLGRDVAPRWTYKMIMPNAEDDRAGEEALLAALQCMTELTTFGWRNARHLLDGGNRLWKVLKASCPHLQILHTIDGHHATCARFLSERPPVTMVRAPARFALGHVHSPATVVWTLFRASYNYLLDYSCTGA